MDYEQMERTAQKIRERVRITNMNAINGRDGKLQIVDDHFVFDVEGASDVVEMSIASMGISQHVERKDLGNGRMRAYAKWPSYAHEVLGRNGIFSTSIPDYEERTEQIKAAALVQRTIETGDVAMIEAATGVGKSFLAVVAALQMGKRIVIATPSKTLQHQYYTKDIPFALQQLRPNGKCVLVQGKANYVCIKRAQDQVSGAWAINHPEFVEWFDESDTGNLEEAEFVLDVDDQMRINVDDSCTGSKCPLAYKCKFRKEREKLYDNPDVIIVNHMWLAIALANPTIDLLPPHDLLIVDEAHQFRSYVQMALGEEFKINNMRKTIDRIGDEFDIFSERSVENFDIVMNDIREMFDRDIETDEDRTIEFGEWTYEKDIDDVLDPISSMIATLQSEISLIAESENPDDQVHARKMSLAVRKLSNIANRIYRLFVHQQDVIRYMDRVDNVDFYDSTISILPVDVSHITSSLNSGDDGYYVSIDTGEPIDVAKPHDPTKCRRCGRELTADLVYIFNDDPYGPTCIHHVDYDGTAEIVSRESWMNRDHTIDDDNVETVKDIVYVKRNRVPVVFMSATLATPDFAKFQRDMGIFDATIFTAESPFSFKNALMYTPAVKDVPCPSKDRSEFIQYSIDVMRDTVNASNGGALLLFTSKIALRNAVTALRPEFEMNGMICFVQGEMQKTHIISEMKSIDNGVIFATKSFFEGVDIKGTSLRLVVLDKLPFPTPSPLTRGEDAVLIRNARQNGEKVDDFYPFWNNAIPQMIIDFKQAFGRLIRGEDDYGVFITVDPRIATKAYGRRNVMQSIPQLDRVRTIPQITEFYREFGHDNTEINDADDALAMLLS